MKLRGENDLRVRASGVGERGLAPPTEASSWLPRSPGQFTCVKKYDKMAGGGPACRMHFLFVICRAGRQAASEVGTPLRRRARLLSLHARSCARPGPVHPQPRWSKAEATAKQIYIYTWRGEKIDRIACNAAGSIDRPAGRRMVASTHGGARRKRTNARVVEVSVARSAAATTPIHSPPWLCPSKPHSSKLGMKASTSISFFRDREGIRRK